MKAVYQAGDQCIQLVFAGNKAKRPAKAGLPSSYIKNRFI